MAQKKKGSPELLHTVIRCVEQTAPEDEYRISCNDTGLVEYYANYNEAYAAMVQFSKNNKTTVIMEKIQEIYRFEYVEQY